MASVVPRSLSFATYAADQRTHHHVRVRERAQDLATWPQFWRTRSKWVNVSQWAAATALREDPRPNAAAVPPGSGAKPQFSWPAAGLPYLSVRLVGVPLAGLRLLVHGLTGANAGSAQSSPGLLGHPAHLALRAFDGVANKAVPAYVAPAWVLAVIATGALVSVTGAVYEAARLVTEGSLLVATWCTLGVACAVGMAWGIAGLCKVQEPAEITENTLPEGLQALPTELQYQVFRALVQPDEKLSGEMMKLRLVNKATKHCFDQALGFTSQLAQNAIVPYLATGEVPTQFAFFDAVRDVVVHCDVVALGKETQRSSLYRQPYQTQAFRDRLRHLLEQAPNLRRLHLCHNQWTRGAGNVASSPALQKVETLRLSNKKRDIFMSRLFQLQDQSSLLAEKDRINCEDVARLLTSVGPKLKCLELFAVDLAQVQKNTFAALENTSLTSLSLRSCEGMSLRGMAFVSRMDAANLGHLLSLNLPDLTSLEVEKYELFHDCLKPFRLVSRAKLKSLSFYGVKNLGDEALADLVASADFKPWHLNLAHTAITWPALQRALASWGDTLRSLTVSPDLAEEPGLQVLRQRSLQVKVPSAPWVTALQ